jgi:hypothetical protein
METRTLPGNETFLRMYWYSTVALDFFIYLTQIGTMKLISVDTIIIYCCKVLDELLCAYPRDRKGQPPIGVGVFHLDR